MLGKNNRTWSINSFSSAASSTETSHKRQPTPPALELLHDSILLPTTPLGGSKKSFLDKFTISHELLIYKYSTFTTLYEAISFNSSYRFLVTSWVFFVTGCVFCIVDICVREKNSYSLLNKNFPQQAGRNEYNFLDQQIFKVESYSYSLLLTYSRKQCTTTSVQPSHALLVTRFLGPDPFLRCRGLLNLIIWYFTVYNLTARFFILV